MKFYGEKMNADTKNIKETHRGNRNISQSKKSDIQVKSNKYNFDFIVDSDSNLLSLITALMVFIASLSAMCVMGVNNLFNAWNQDLNGQITIQALPFDKKNNVMTKVELKKKVDDILINLKSRKEFSNVNLITDSEIDEMLKPWLGASVESFDIPIPYLIDAKVDYSDDGEHTNLAVLERDLKDVFGPLSIEDHKKWLTDIRKIKSSVQFLAYFILVAIILTTSVTVIYTTSASFKAQKNSVEIFHLIGAFDEFIASQFARSVFKLTLLGSLTGFVLFLIVFGVIAAIISDLTGTIFDYMQFSFVDVFTIFSIPFISAMLAKSTAKNTVLQIIGKVK
ncbi:MAG: hypothetical protein LBU68_01560 [Rickettsiales bacterium]|jgi:cell division transport system permease protein|nr:hypothetical protein [Rickettsiales bacterium]